MEIVGVDLVERATPTRRDPAASTRSAATNAEIGEDGGLVVRTKRKNPSVSAAPLARTSHQDRDPRRGPGVPVR